LVKEFFAFGALTLLAGRQEGHPDCKKLEWWGAGIVVCLEQDATATHFSCFSKIQIGFTFPVLAHLGSPGQRAVKRVCGERICFGTQHRRLETVYVTVAHRSRYIAFCLFVLCR